MKILYIARQYEPSRGGIETVVGNLARALQMRGTNCQVLTLNRSWGNLNHLPPDEILDGIRIHRIPYYGSKHYAFAPFPMKYLQEFDLIHLHSSDFFLDYLAVSRFFHQKPLVLTTHGLYFHSTFAKNLKKIYFRTITRLALMQINRVLVNSQQDYCLVSQIVPSRKISIIPNGVSEDLLKIDNLRREPKRILAVGRLANNKRYDLLLNAFAKACQCIPDLSLVVIGKDDGELSRLQELSNVLGVSNRVEWLNEVSQSDLVDQLSRAKVWAIASEYESFGVGLLEGMAAGCLPVVSLIPAHAELVKDSQSGFLVNYKDSLQASQKICSTVYLSESYRDEMQRKARLLVEQYTWPKIAGRVEQVYMECLRNHIGQG